MIGRGLLTGDAQHLLVFTEKALYATGAEDIRRGRPPVETLRQVAFARRVGRSLQESPVGMP